MFEGFTEEMIDAGDLRLLVRHGGTGPAVMLIHGHPRTSSTWHRVAAALVDQGFTVICADLPGYGRSDKPTPTADHRPHSKRVGAQRLRAVMSALGHDSFAVVGHDRGGLYGLRLALDYPEAVTRAAFLDCIPVSEHLRRVDTRFATAYWHWFFFAQPEIPERVITADPDSWYTGDPEVMGAENHAEWRRAVSDPAVIRGMLEDYRAGLTVDNADERADRVAGRRLRQPVLVLWSLRDDLEDLHGDPRIIWRGWADDVTGHGLPSGHHVAEELSAELATELSAFFNRASSVR